MQGESVTLYFKEGSSDKVYQAQLEAAAGGFSVRFQYGRRGSALTAGVKTPQPVPFEQAKKVYDALVKSKTSKGYTPAECGTPYQASANEKRVTGLDVQVLTPITFEEADRHIRDDNFVEQEKFDGERRPVANRDGVAVGSNKLGLAVALPVALAESIQRLPVGTELDCEQVGDVLHVFDLLSNAGVNMRGFPFIDRYEACRNVLKGAGWPQGLILADLAVTTNEKAAMFERMKRGEGVVFKRKLSLYRPGNGKNPDQVKFKFVESATLEVSAVHPTKRSVSVQVYDGDRVVPLGNVTIGVDKEIPAVGDIVEVRYLYCVTALFQTVYLGKRSDQTRASCTLSQIKFKAAS